MPTQNKLLLLFFIALSLQLSSSYLNKCSDFPEIFTKNYVDSQQSLDIKTSCDKVNLPGNSSSDRIIYSGYLNVKIKNSNSALYYIFYGSQDIGNNTKLLSNRSTILWLNGGPGSSSLLGNFYENGPFQVQSNSQGEPELVQRPVHWNQNYNMLFIDQPIGTGASYAQNYSDIPTNQGEVAEQFYQALQNFYQLDCFQSIQKSDLFLFGESYAGKYVPEISKRILQGNKNLTNSSSDLLLPLKASGFGDGFTKPETVLAEVGMFAFNLGLIDFQERIDVEKNILRLSFAIQNKQWELAHNLSSEIWDPIVQQSGGVNIYNYRIFGNYNFSALTAYLNSNKIIYNINQNISWVESSDSVYKALYQDFMQDSIEAVEYIVQNGHELLIYNGQDDLIVTNPGTMTWMDKLNWSGASNFTNLDFTIWKNSTQNVVGYKKMHENLEFRIVNKAGHLVPQDQPESAKLMLDEFVQKVQQKNAEKRVSF